MLISGWWTNTAYQRFDQLPGHYDWRGRVTRMEKRVTMAWLLPGMFSVILAVLMVLLLVLPPEMINGDPSVGLYLASAVLFASQLSVLWLLSRWAKQQG